jgi:plastocyanin
MRSRRLARSAVLAGLVAAALVGVASRVDSGPSAGGVRGRVVLDLAGASVADVGPVVVFLDGIDKPLSFAPPEQQPAVHQRDARFAPSFIAVAAGTTVQMPNDDAIFHNVFSYSKPNDFDLGLYPAGQSRSVTFRYPGVVKAYCSIHESMNGTIYVSPSPWFTTAGASGTFSIAGVPPGRYKLETWCEKLPATEREIAIRPGETLSVDLKLGAAKP